MRRIASMAQGYQICHCEERSDVAISQNPTGQQGSHRRNRNGLPEIAPPGHFLALRAQGATAPLGPRNDKLEGLAPQNACRKDCQLAWRSLSAAATAILSMPCRLPEIATSNLAAYTVTERSNLAAYTCPYGLLAMTNLVAGTVGGVHRNLQLPMALTERRYSQTWQRIRSAMPFPFRQCLPEIATAPLGPRNDKLEGLAPQNACRKDCQPARRSLSAATFFSRAAALYNERRYRRNRCPPF